MLVIFYLKGGLKLPRDGAKNLTPMNKRSLEEQKELQRKGGKASGIARRRKADLKKAFETLLSLDVTDSKIKKQLEEMGIAGNNEVLLAFAIFQQAIKGNQKATENIIKLTITKDKYDIQEQKDRIKALKKFKTTKPRIRSCFRIVVYLNKAMFLWYNKSKFVLTNL